MTGFGNGRGGDDLRTGEEKLRAGRPAEEVGEQHGGGD